MSNSSKVIKTYKTKVLVINTSFQELDHFVAALCKTGYLVFYIRPYLLKMRLWEQVVFKIPFFDTIFNRSFGRRLPVDGIVLNCVKEVGVTVDFFMALLSKLNCKFKSFNSFKSYLVDFRTKCVGYEGKKNVAGNSIVVASWSCAKPAFETAKTNGAVRILNYSLAHHRYTRKFLTEEAKLNPSFAASLNSHNYPDWFVKQLDDEIFLADHILVGSTFVKRSFIQEGVDKKKLTVIPYGVDVNLFEPTFELKDNSVFNVLFVGQIGQRKGISYLLDAYQQFMREDTRLTLVGNFQGPDEIFSSYSHLFRHISHVPHTVLKSIYQHADIFVFPTLIEGMPIVVLEAMACGLPVITTPNGCDDIVRDGVDGFLVPVRDVNAIVEKMELLRTDHVLRTRMAKSARDRAMSFNWSQYEAKVVDFVEKVSTKLPD